MNESDARSYIEVRLQPAVWPTLDTTEVDELVKLAAVADENDVDPYGTDWVPTFDVMGCIRAIADGYSVKLAKSLPKTFEFTTDGQTFRRQQLADHLESREKHWRSKIIASVATGSTS